MTISLKELKKNRLTPAEKYVLDFIEGVVPKTLSDGNIGWWKEGDFLFIQDFKTSQLLVSWGHIWVVLRYDFGLTANEVQELIKNVMYGYTNNGKLTPTHT